MLNELRRANLLDMDDCAVDGSHVRALEGGSRRPLTCRSRPPGSKHHLIVDRHRTPLAVTPTGGNQHDVTRFCRCTVTSYASGSQAMSRSKMRRSPSSFRESTGMRP